MHTNKNRFSLSKDLIHGVSQLPNDKAGELFKYILSFVNNQEITSDDFAINAMLEPIKLDIIRDSSIRINRSMAGRASAQLKKQLATNVNNSQQTSTNVNKLQQTSTNVNNSQQTVTNSKSVAVAVANKNPIDYEQIITVFNKVCKGLSQASVTPDRKKKINTLLKTYTLEQIGQVFIKTSQSDYLMGRKVEWKADLSWILKPDNFVRILEGIFDNHHVNKNPDSPEEQWQEVNDAVNKFYDPE